MKLYYFSEMPHHEYPDEEGVHYPSLRLAFPNRFFDRTKAASNYQRYLTEYELADLGFDGLAINEHHSTLLRERGRQHDGGRPRPDDPG
jgi:hypothetical protein